MYCKSRFAWVISCIPLIYTLFIWLCQYLPWQGIVRIFCYSPSWGYGMPDYQYISALTYTEWTYYIPIFLSVADIGIVYLSFLWLYQSGYMDAGIMFLVFSAGLCSRLVMGFTPTLYGSSFRTFTFFYFALGTCIILALKTLACNSKSKWFGRTAVLLGVISTYYISLGSIV